MGSSCGEVTVHIDETLDYPWFDVVKKVVKGINGVKEVDISDESPHFMLVKYTAELTSLRSIQDELSHIGYHTKLVGL